MTGILTHLNITRVLPGISRRLCPIAYHEGAGKIDHGENLILDNAAMLVCSETRTSFRAN